MTATSPVTVVLRYFFAVLGHAILSHGPFMRAAPTRTHDMTSRVGTALCSLHSATAYKAQVSNGVGLRNQPFLLIPQRTMPELSAARAQYRFGVPIPIKTLPAQLSEQEERNVTTVLKASV